MSAVTGCPAVIRDGAFKSTLVSLAPGAKCSEENCKQEKGGPGAPTARYLIQTALQNSFLSHGNFSPLRLVLAVRATAHGGLSPPSLESEPQTKLRRER